MPAHDRASDDAPASAGRASQAVATLLRRLERGQFAVHHSLHRPAESFR